MKYLYKYPQASYPYGDLVATNGHRSRREPEYELLDTGVFDQDRYFDVFVECAKAAPEDLLIQVTVCNRGGEPATLHVLPTVWFRNTWSWGGDAPRPSLRQATRESQVVSLSHPELGKRFLHADGKATLLFTENETNNERLFGVSDRTPYVKDACDRYLVQGQKDAVNPERAGTKAAVHYPLIVPAGKSQTLRLRLRDVAPAKGSPPFGDFDAVMEARRREADEFYATVVPPAVDEDAANVMRQALAGMMWTKQFYNYDLDTWLAEHGADPFKPRRAAPRNDHRHHMTNADVISMPDKWEYPWYAAWDLAFHGLDGALQPEHAGDRRAAGAREAGLHRPVRQVRPALPVDRVGHGPCRRGHGDVGRGGWLLLRRPPSARRALAAPEGALHGRASPPLRRHRLRGRAARQVPGGGAAPQHVPGGAAGLRRRRQVPGRPELARPHPVLRVLPRRHGQGLGASHQTGWTGIVAQAMHLFATTTPAQVLELGNRAAVTEVAKGATRRGGSRRKG